MKKKKEEKFEIQIQAYLQIFVLIVATFAFSFIMGGGLVSAADDMTFVRYSDGRVGFVRQTTIDGKTVIQATQKYTETPSNLDDMYWYETTGKNVQEVVDAGNGVVYNTGQTFIDDARSEVYKVGDDYSITKLGDQIGDREDIYGVQNADGTTWSAYKIEDGEYAGYAPSLGTGEVYDIPEEPVELKDRNSYTFTGTSRKPTTDQISPLGAAQNKLTDLKTSLADVNKNINQVQDLVKEFDTLSAEYSTASPERQVEIASRQNQINSELEKLGTAEDLTKQKNDLSSQISKQENTVANLRGTAAEEYNFLGIKFKAGEGAFGGRIGHTIGNIAEGLTWATLVWTAVSTLQSMGVLDEEQTKSLGPALFSSILAGKAVYGIVKDLGWGDKWASGLGWAAAIITFILTYEEVDYRTREVNFKCLPWQAPSGGADCDECNEDDLRPCSEYRCKSLGQTCGIINEGTDKVQCIDMSPYDTASPGIRPLYDKITNGYEYREVVERPAGGSTESAGMRITKKGGSCIDPFTEISFGIQTFNEDNELEPAQCKFDINHTNSFGEMAYYLGDENLYVINHTQKLYLPSPNTVESIYPEIEMDGVYTWYIRCKDGNGNTNEDEFAIRFCVDDGPDLTVPQIKDTSIKNGQPVRYKTDNLSLEIYVSEPVEGCKWSREDSDYSNMENDFSCSNNIWEINAESLYTCDTTLTAIEDRIENKFYFACKDLNNNTMRQNYEFTLMGTQPLDILEVSPNETVGGSTETVVVSLGVETDNGYQNGESTCYYSTTGEVEDYLEMFDTGGNIHSQDLDLEDGDYTYYFRCVDEGGNDANASTSFNVFVDKYEPVVVRTYYEGQKIKVLTDEDANCRYSTQTCNFDFKDGELMPYEQDVEHFTPWERGTSYFIKCADKYNNQPDPMDCSIIVLPYEKG